MEILRVVICFFAILLILFIMNGIFVAIFVFMKVFKLIIIAGIVALIYYLITKNDTKGL